MITSILEWISGQADYIGYLHEQGKPTVEAFTRLREYVDYLKEALENPDAPRDIEDAEG